MNFRVKRIWWVVVPTVLVVLAFQFYWLSVTYKDQQRVFRDVVSDALLRAYDRAVLEKVLGFEKSVVEKTGAMSANLTAVTVNSAVSSGGKTFADSVSIPGQNMADYAGHSQSFLSAMLASSPTFRPDIKILAAKVTALLNERGVKIPFTLSFAQKDAFKDSIGIVAVPLSALATETLVQAKFTGLRQYLLWQMRWPAVISLLILLIVAGCIWTLWRIILKQKALETMRADLVSNMTHELNTPVAILHTINEALLTYDGIGDKIKAERYLRLSKNELNKLQAHIQEILAVSRLENGMNRQPKEEVSVPDVVHTIAERFNHLPGVVLDIHLDIQQPTVLTHAESLQIILSNLVDNAIKYADKEEKRIEIQVTEEKRSYRFSINDNGIGISKQYIPYLFDKFYRVPQGNIHDVKGYGLGLSHVKELLHGLGGTIKIDSQPGQGSSFVFQIPTS